MGTFAGWLNQERTRRNLSLRGLARLAGDLDAPDVAVRRRALAAVLDHAVLQADGSLDVYWRATVMVSAATPGPSSA